MTGSIRTLECAGRELHQRPNAWSGQKSWPTLCFGTNPERLIAWGRLISALFAALAIYLDPTSPARSLGEAHLVLAAYVVFSLCLAFRAPRRSLVSKVHLFTHGLDVLALATLFYLTDELDSPFFPFVPFILLATTMRWGICGAVLGALAMELMMLAVGWQDLTDGDSELNVVIMRSAYFLVAAAMLGYFGACRARSSHRFAQLAAWSAAPADLDERSWLQDMLDHASSFLGAERLVLIWRDQATPGNNVAMFGPEGLLVKNGLPWQPRMPPEPENENSLKAETAELDALANVTGWTQLETYSRWLRSAPFLGSRIVGRLYVFNGAYDDENSASLARITASRIGQELERYGLMRASADRARDQERVRLARDLHDSVLQDLAAASLRLKTTTASMPKKTQQSLAGVSRLLTEQQRRIRNFVENSRTLEAAPAQLLSASLAQSINDLCDQWGCDIMLSIHPPEMEAAATVRRELTQLLCEATANAVRHGGATRLQIDLTRQEEALHMSIADNGCGLSSSMADGAQHPRSLQARVADMEGSLAITRHAPGLAMMIEIPHP